jgi:hypothetical protein
VIWAKQFRFPVSLANGPIRRCVECWRRFTGDFDFSHWRPDKLLMAKSLPGVPSADFFSERGGSPSRIFRFCNGLRDPGTHATGIDSGREFPGVQLGQPIGLDLGIETGLDVRQSVFGQPACFLGVVDQRDDRIP